jgi:hypothetical protein
MSEVFPYSRLTNFLRLEPNEQNVRTLPHYSGAVSKMDAVICNNGILTVHICCCDIT